ncbi:conjugal transfer protein TraX [Paenibacillus sambharensis]|uniref:Conjugal transfer protein TraX n=1 Tax=Paenibacillus sambharensis TaxID=1803190 RepID=A0A2W1LW17_9BACL|nr:TraX family protein [Paenibacillus sambharensis]PZD95981.1 conjugal transfer protein TraX [Paenibacillus sambharensis]
MQLLAMLTMLIDHTGIVFFPDDPTWRIIGRLAFPFYAYALVLGYRLTRNTRRYMLRLAVIGVISQLPYQWALGGDDINVVGTLLVCLVVLRLIDLYKHPAAVSLILAAGFLALDLLSFNYGSYALLLVLIYRYTQSSLMVLLHFVLNVLYAAAMPGWFSQMYSIGSTFILAYLPHVLRLSDKLVIPRYIWRSFYPVHLIALGTADLLLKS